MNKSHSSSFFLRVEPRYSYIFILVITLFSCRQETIGKPNVILVMADDQGWGQVEYYNHPVLKTPNLNAMAKSGLRLDRFYAGAPVCSPTRASVLTGRANDRSAVYAHGMPMRIQEKTIAQALHQAGYQTAHFGKWHLNGLRGPGVPILKEDRRNPGFFGFDQWISVTNFFDINPVMSVKGEIQEFDGSSSNVIVRQALDFISGHQDDPFFVVIWYGSPHNPWSALTEDQEELPESLDEKQKNYLGEIVEMDRSIGLLRGELKKMGLSQNTLIWYNSDNGGVSFGGKEGVGGLRGFKGSVYEGGLRVPCIIEWPDQIKGGQISNYPASTMDIFPTLAAVLNLPDSTMTHPTDGRSIAHIFQGSTEARDQLIPFKYGNKGALIDNDFKLVAEDIEKQQYALYNLVEDQIESNDLLSSNPEKALEMIEYYEDWLTSVANSVAGNDYQGGLTVPDPKDQFWWDVPGYQPFINQWKDRPEYHDRLEGANKIDE